MVDAVDSPVADGIGRAAGRAGEDTKNLLPRIHTDIEKATARVVAFPVRGRNHEDHPMRAVQARRSR